MTVRVVKEEDPLMKLTSEGCSSSKEGREGYASEFMCKGGSMAQEGWGGCHKEERSHSCKMALGAKQAGGGGGGFLRPGGDFVFILRSKGNH